MDINRKSNLFQEVETSLIQKIFAEKLHVKKLLTIELISGGLFNTSYKVKDEVQTYIIRFSPVNQHLVMGFEEHLMAAENYVYSLCKKHRITCPEVLVCDTSRHLLDRDYMITFCIPGTVMADAKLSATEKEKIYEDMGEYAGKLHAVTNDRFGFVSRILTENHAFTWSECLIREVKELLTSLKCTQYFTSEEAEAILRVFTQNQELLDEIQTPHLMHTDLWEGNVILSFENERPFIKTIIDGDRAVFGDVDFEWAAPWMDMPGIRRGAGLKQEEFFAPKRRARQQIYRIFYAVMNCYIGAFEYNDRELFHTGKREAMLLLNGYHLVKSN